MDKKTKKRLSVLRDRAQRLRQQIAAEKKQTDEPELIAQLEKELSDLLQEIEKTR